MPLFILQFAVNPKFSQPFKKYIYILVQAINAKNDLIFLFAYNFIIIIVKGRHPNTTNRWTHFRTNERCKNQSI